MIDLQGMELVSPVHWIEESQIKLANGEIYAFDERPYLINPLNSRARLKCVRKARGLGFSETEILGKLHGLRSGRYKQGVQYVFPNDVEMRTFVQSRFNVVLRKNPQTLGKFVKDTDTTYYKRVGEGNLFMDGGSMNKVIEGLQAESMTFRSRQVDAAVIDELDLFENANEVISAALTSMMNSECKEVTVLSNPSIPNYGIDKLFQQSNQMGWYRQCRCGELTSPDKEFPDLIDRKGCHCRKCGDLLPWRGMWIADYPQVNDLYGPNARQWEGYHISDLNAPKVDPWTIKEQWQDKSDANQEKVNKFSLGLPFMPKTCGLSLTEVYDCCGIHPEYDKFEGPSVMGVDVGGTSGFHAVIGYRTARDMYEVIHEDVLGSFDDVAVWGHRLGVKTCVCDMLPEVTGARRFQKDAGFRVWLCIYPNTQVQLEDIAWDDERRLVKVSRTFVCDTTHRLVIDGRIKFPRRSRKMEEFAKQYIVPVKIKDAQRENLFRYESFGRPDHFRHATNYFYMAAQRSGIVRKLGGVNVHDRQLVTQADTQRYI